MANGKAMPTQQAKGNFPLLGDPDIEVVCVNIDPDIDYQSIVSSLQYLVSCSRPDIVNAVRTLGKYLNCYTNERFVLCLSLPAGYARVWIGLAQARITGTAADRFR